MKFVKLFLSLILSLAVILASCLPTYAIGFSAEEVYKSIFVIYSGNSLGSGFALGKNCVITNAHVIKNKANVTVKTYDGTEYPAKVIGLDEVADIAVLTVANANFPTLKASDKFNVGDDVYAIGAPKSMEYTLTKGVVSAKSREIKNASYIQIDVAINEGNSGGPLLSDSGSVLGMNTLKLDNSEGIGFAIPISTVISYLNKLGIKTDDNGNTVGEIAPTEPEETTKATEPGAEADNNRVPQTRPSEAKSSPVATIVAAISIILNVILIIMLIHQKKKNLIIKYDPKERTDFEIDILE